MTMGDVTGGRLGSLVDAEHGIVSREIFVSDEIYRQELERIFARAWLFLGHESQSRLSRQGERRLERNAGRGASGCPPSREGRPPGYLRGYG
jgi:hypothetical protein